MAEAIQFYRSLIPAMYAARDGIPPTRLEAHTCAQKLSAGTPILLNEALDFRPADSQRVFASLCYAAAQGCTTARDEGEAHALEKILDIQTALTLGVMSGDWNALDPRSLLFMIASGDTQGIQAAAEGHCLDPQMLLLLAQNTFKVFLRAWRADLEPRVDLSDWQRVHCPFCGALPGLSEVRGPEAARHLRCLECGADWPYPNLTCAFCGNDDHRTLGVLRLETPIQRAYAHTCNMCRHYIKTILTFEPTPADLLIIADLETLQLDQVARGKGYL